MASYLHGYESYSGRTYSQVYQATHDGEGNSLPQLNRSFISFTFGGKPIEDFGVITVIDGDRMEKSLYASFNDNTTTIDTRNGQLYWGSAIAANELSFTLATDGMDEKQLDDFREWFAPGKIRELILAEHPNRAILARVAEAPTYSFLPFEKETTIKIGNNTPVSVKTTIYKGDIDLKFVMDDPYWYAKLNYMPEYVNKVTLEELSYDSEDINKVTTSQNADMLKIMLEDGIPHQSILLGDNSSTFFLGGNYLVTEIAIVGIATVNHSHVGITVETSNGLDIDPDEGPQQQYLFYSGTAKSYPIIQFSMIPEFDSNGYIKNPQNKIQNGNDNFIRSNFQIGNKIFEFTTPSILTGYNQAIQIFNSAENKSAPDLLEELRDKINEKYSRAWAIGCLKALQLTGAITSQNIINLKTYMKRFISTELPMTFIFNSKTGEAEGTFYVKILNTLAATVTNVNTATEIKENVGDMICSDYLTIEGRDYLNSDGEITLENCHIITSNEKLTNVLVLYQNMYL